MIYSGQTVEGKERIITIEHDVRQGRIPCAVSSGLSVSQLDELERRGPSIQMDANDFRKLIAQARRAIELEEKIKSATVTLAEMKGYLKGVER